MIAVSQISWLLPLLKNVPDTLQGLVSDRCLYYDDASCYYAVIIIIYHINPSSLPTWKLRTRTVFPLCIPCSRAQCLSLAFDEFNGNWNFPVLSHKVFAPQRLLGYHLPSCLWKACAPSESSCNCCKLYVPYSSYFPWGAGRWFRVEIHVEKAVLLGPHQHENNVKTP